MTTILVTGGVGFIGTNLVESLTCLYDKVIVVDLVNESWQQKNCHALSCYSNVHIKQMDITDRQAVLSLFEEYLPDWVLHLAAETHVDKSIADPALFLSSNIWGTFHLVDMAATYCQRKGCPNDFRFYYCSTDEVYGSLGTEGSFHEMLPLHPNNPYSATKAAGEHLLTAWANTFGLPFLISRCSNNYGQYQGTDKFVPLTIHRCLSKQPILIHGDGSNIRNWLYVKDHVKAISAVMKHGVPGEVYNIGAGTESELTNLTMAEMICDTVDEVQGHPQGMSRQLITFVQDRPGNDKCYSIDSTKLHECSGWQPETPLIKGLRTTVEWYVKNSKADLNKGA